MALYAGTSEPYGAWPQQGAVSPVPQRASLLAAFNAGFKIYSYHTGWYDQGRTAVAPPGRRRLIRHLHQRHRHCRANGVETSVWSRPWSAVRQNLTLLVDHGVAAANVDTPSEWGAVLGGGTITWRSGVGVTAAGDLVYAGRPRP